MTRRDEYDEHAARRAADAAIAHAHDAERYAADLVLAERILDDLHRAEQDHVGATVETFVSMMEPCAMGTVSGNRAGHVLDTLQELARSHVTDVPNGLEGVVLVPISVVAAALWQDGFMVGHLFAKAQDETADKEGRE